MTENGQQILFSCFDLFFISGRMASVMNGDQSVLNRDGDPISVQRPYTRSHERADDKPWLKHYEQNVPHQIEPPSLTLPDLLPAAAGRYPDRTAIVLAVAAAGRLFGYPISYARLHQDVIRFAASLQGLGVQTGDRVAIFLPNCPQFAIAFLAAVQIGAIAVPFNPLYSARETEHQLKDCGANVMIVLDRFLPIVQQVQSTTALKARGRHPHQGILPALALDALYVNQRAQTAPVQARTGEISGSPRC